MPYGNEAEDAFGKCYSLNPSKFRFLPGDRKLIEAIIIHANQAHVKEILRIESMKSNDKLTQSESYSFEEYAQRTKYFLNKLQSAADMNLKRKRGGFRFDEEIKLYASYLRMLCGPMAYNTIQRNLEGALPSLVSTNRYIKASDCKIVEGELRSRELLKYLEERKLPLVVCLSEDATRIEARVQYDSTINQIIGFTPPINKETGMPITYAFTARNLKEILKHFSNGNSISSFINVIMAQPLAIAPPFCLILFGSDCEYTSEDIMNRWMYITRELEKLNIKVFIIASDSDPKYNSAMKQLSGLGSNVKSPSLNWFTCNLQNTNPFFVQDPTHIGTKLRNFLLRFYNKMLAFGPKYYIQLEHLYILLNTFTKDQHLLTASTLNPADRQNFSSVLRMCSEKVTTLLKSNVKNSEATVVFLEMIRDVLDSYMNKNLPPLIRIEKIWYQLFVLRLWRQYIKSHPTLKLKDNFLTANCYTCIELNAHSLILILLYLKNHNLPSWFLTHLYSSQPCESTFRQLRLFSSIFSASANCSVKESLSKISKIQLQNEIVNSDATHFFYPKSNDQNDKSIHHHELPTKIEILNTIEKCKLEAIKTAKRLGFKILNNTNLFSCDISTVTSHKQKNKKKKIKVDHVIMNTFARQLRVSDFKNIDLKNYVDKHPNPDERSPFVKLHNSKVVKKISLCWFLRNDYLKLSTDRNRRVMELTENVRIKKIQANLQKKQNISCPIYKYKSKKKTCKLRSNILNKP